MAPATRSVRIARAPRAAARDEAPVLGLDDVEHALGDPVGVDVARVDAQALGQRHAVGRQALADLVRRGERVLGRDVVAVGAQAAQVGRAGVHELRPPVGQVGRHLDANVRHEPSRLRHQPLHVLDADRRRPLRQVDDGAPTHVGQTGAPERLGRVGGDLRRLLAVVAAVGNEVLQDHLLQVPVLRVHRGQRLQRGHAVVLALADANQDPARERDAQLAGLGVHAQAHLGILVGAVVVRAALLAQSLARALEHQAERGVALAQLLHLGGGEDAGVAVRKDPAGERQLARLDEIFGGRR
jgi:hypothetical protein